MFKDSYHLQSTYLGNDHRPLDNCKIFEMHKCIPEYEPEIIIRDLAETFYFKQ